MNERDNKIISNLRLVHKVANKYTKNYNDYDDNYSAGVIGLIKAVDNYDDSIGIPFSSFVWICIRNELLMDCKRRSKFSKYKLVSLDENNCTFLDGGLLFNETIANDEEPIIDQIITLDEYERVNQVLGLLPEETKETIKLYFGFYDDHEYDQTSIATKLNRCQPSISKRIAKGIKQIKEEL